MTVPSFLSVAGSPITGSGTLAVTLSGTALPAINGGTGQIVYAVGDILFADTTTTLSKLNDVAVGSYLRSGGASIAPLWSTLKLPNTATTGDLMVATATNSIASVTDVAVGRVLVSGGVGVIPSYSATPTLGVAGTTLGSLSMTGNTSGTVTIKPVAIAGTYNFNLPITAGTVGQPLLSGGGGAAAMTFGTLGPAAGGTGVANNAAMTVTGSGNFAYTRTLTGVTNVTFPTTGTLVSNSVATDFTAQQNITRTSLTDVVSGTVTWDGLTQQNANITLTAGASNTRTLGAMTNQKIGGTYRLRIVQSATGPNLMTFNAIYKFPGNVAPTLSTTANSKDIFTFESDGTNMECIGWTKGLP